MHILGKAHVTNFQKLCWSVKNIHSLSVAYETKKNYLFVYFEKGSRHKFPEILLKYEKP